LSSTTYILAYISAISSNLHPSTGFSSLGWGIPWRNVCGRY